MTNLVPLNDRLANSQCPRAEATRLQENVRTFPGSEMKAALARLSFNLTQRVAAVSRVAGSVVRRRGMLSTLAQIFWPRFRAPTISTRRANASKIEAVSFLQIIGAAISAREAGRQVTAPATAEQPERPPF
jgi:hypothetical protein